MTRPGPFAALALAALIALPATSPPARAAAAPVASASPPAARHAAPARGTPRAAARAAHGAARSRAAADSAGRARPKVAPRTLDEIHIEGEIPVPQVLFITAREQRRFMEFQHHRYQKSSLELGRSTPLPSRVVVTSPATAERKENQR